MNYLKNLILHNVGPIENLAIQAEFDADGNPKPIVFVGTNGSGKTIALSTVVDAIHELAADAGFSDVCEPSVGGGRRFFRVSGGGLQKSGAQKYLCGLTFESTDGAIWKYFDKAGAFEEGEWKALLGEKISWPSISKENSKQNSFNGSMPNAIAAQEIDKLSFQNSAFCYFPANRSEQPFWSTQSSNAERVNDGLGRFSNLLGKPIVCTATSFQNATWLMDVILDDLAQEHTERINLLQQLKLKADANQSFDIDLLQNLSPAKRLTVLENANQVLSVLLGCQARFAVTPRQSNKRLHFMKTATDAAESLHISHLSHGQSSLLGIFCTIMRYADAANPKNLADINGIVLIDEADAGLHIDYQHQVLPKLMRLMPKVQFIISTHSPLLLLGLERQYGIDGVQIVEAPSGNRISAEVFPEFKEAFLALESTTIFKKSLAEIISREQKKPVLLVEGQSDELLLRAAWGKLRSGDFPFSISGKLDRTHLRLVLSDISKTGLDTSLPILALWDFDDAYADWKTLIKRKNSHYLEIDGRLEESGLLFKSKNEKQIFGALLPIPSFRASQASRIFGASSVMCIELLFYDTYLNNLNAIEELSAVGGGKIVRIKARDKIKLAESLCLLPSEAFENFEPLLKMLYDTLLPALPANVD